MNFNFATLTFGSLAAIALLAAPIGIVNIAHAQNGAQGNGPRGGGRIERLTQALDLSEDQVTQIESIHTESQSQKDAILTAEQRATLESSETQGRRAWRQLDLSDGQKEQMRALRDSTREQVSAVLTPEQRTQMEELHAARGKGRGHRGGERLEQLNLTDAQSAEIETIRTSTRTQMEALLTTEQRATLESSDDTQGRRAWRQLDLSDTQKEQMRALREASHEQIQGVLTEEQRQQLEDMRQERGNRRGERQSNRRQGQGFRASR
ncbi:MAG: Spy/CpxP family protein refolding chaperone [Cyanobacteria bacterium P01_A01_bin.116]